MKDMIDCLIWKKQYRIGEHLDTRTQDLANAIVCQGQCCPPAWNNLAKCEVIESEERIYHIEFEYKEDGWEVFDEFMPGRLNNNDFEVVLKKDGFWLVVDTLGLDDMMTGKVIICDMRGHLEMTLAEAIERFGIKKEGNPEDARRFARCPSLNGFLGPMYPNAGFIARYETQEVYNTLSS